MPRVPSILVAALIAAPIAVEAQQVDRAAAMAAHMRLCQNAVLSNPGAAAALSTFRSSVRDLCECYSSIAASAMRREEISAFLRAGVPAPSFADRAKAAWGYCVVQNTGG